MDRNFRLLVFAIGFCLVSLFSSAQTENRSGMWSAYFIDYKLSDKFFVRNEVHMRRTDFLKNWNQLVIRPALHFKLNSTVSFSGGYTFLKNFREPKNFNANNIWQQVTLKHASGKLKFTHWFRFEQRFIEQFTQTGPNTFVEDDHRFLTRMRYRFAMSHPLFKFKNGRALNANMFEEIWLNTGSGILPESLNQNWFQIGVDYKLIKNLKFIVGYLNVYAPQGNDSFVSNHILNTLMIYTIN